MRSTFDKNNIKGIIILSFDRCASDRGEVEAPMPAPTTSSQRVLHRRGGYDEALVALAHTARCSFSVAKDAMKCGEQVVREARKLKYQPVNVTHTLRGTRGFAVLERAFLVGEEPAPGSAAELIARVLLDDQLGEYRLTYSSEGLGKFRVYTHKRR